jgi:hypothetical protein
MHINAGFVVRTVQKKIIDFARLGISLVAIVGGISQQANAWDDGTIGPYAISTKSRFAPQKNQADVIDERNVERVCQKYNHCKGASGTGIDHLQNLEEHLSKLISKNLKLGCAACGGRVRKISDDKNSLHPSPINVHPPIKSSKVLANIARIANQPISGDVPSKAEAEQSIILGVCATYHHCSSQMVDQLHCYQLESLLLEMRRKKGLLVQTPEIKKEIEDLDADLLKLNTFRHPDFYDQ